MTSDTRSSAKSSCDGLSVSTRARYLSAMLSLRTFVLAGTIAVVASVAVACGGGDDDGASEPQTEADVAEAVEQFYANFRDNDVRAMYDSMSAACRERVSYSDFAEQMALGRAQVESVYQVDPDELVPDDIVVTDFQPERAGVTLRLTVESDDSFTVGEPSTVYLFEEGAWRSTDCEQFD